MSVPVPSADSAASSGPNPPDQRPDQPDSVSITQPLSEALSGLNHAVGYAQAVGSVVDAEARLNATNATLVIAASVAKGVLAALVWSLMLVLAGWWLSTFGISIGIILSLALIINLGALIVISRYLGAMLDQFGFPQTLALLGGESGD